MPKSKYSTGNLILAVIMMLFGILMIVPVIWMVSTAFKTEAQIWQHNWIPDPFTLENFETVVERIPVFRMLMNSFIVSITATLGQLLTATLAAYAFARINFFGRNVLFMMFLGTMMIPGTVIIIPLYLIVDSLGLINTYGGLIIPSLVSIFAIFLLRQFFFTIPRDLDESAYIDGASRFRILFQIIVPLSKPAYAALFIFSFMAVWNDFLWPLLVTTGESMRPIQVGLAYFQMGFTMDFGATMAASFIASAPIIIVFLFANKYFVEGITLTGIKG